MSSHMNISMMKPKLASTFITLFWPSRCLPRLCFVTKKWNGLIRMRVTNVNIDWSGKGTTPVINLDFRVASLRFLRLTNGWIKHIRLLRKGQRPSDKRMSCKLHKKRKSILLKNNGGGGFFGQSKENQTKQKEYDNSGVFLKSNSVLTACVLDYFILFTMFLYIRHKKWTNMAAEPA